jgi:dUTP pyrophosphatase
METPLMLSERSKIGHVADPIGDQRMDGGVWMSTPDPVLVQRLHEAARLPERARPGDAAWDLFADTECVIPPGGRALIGTGIAIALSPGYAGFVLARSGRALREGFGLVNAPGLIDAGYRGEIKVIAVNHDDSRDIVVQRGDRIAQLVVQRVHESPLIEVEQLPGTQRNDAGFGSSGS